MDSISVNTANTLSTAFSPGQDILFGNTSSQAIFTHGDFNIGINSEPDILTGTNLSLQFTSYSTLDSMGVSDFNPTTYTSIQNNELRPIGPDPYSYSYFGSFYTEVARSINNVLDTFPYAILSFDSYTGSSIYDYTESFNLTTGVKSSSFKLPLSAITNQGNILFSSGSPIGTQVSLMTQTSLFEIQLSGATTAQTTSYKINSYTYTGGTGGALEFEINGFLSNGAVSPITGGTSELPVYIRPSEKRVTEYRIGQSRLERQLLRDGLFDIPDVDDERRNFRYRIPWPRTIDGFSPDNSGSNFETYKDNILLLAGNTDVDKTDIMIKTIIPENYLDFDSDTQIYRKVVYSYAKQFDEIKQFIDNIAYAHTLNYNNEGSVPEKFLVKLSNLLGWKLSSSFSEIDLFSYLADDENPDQNSFAYYNVELWKRILININWLYKKKGTRDAIQFLFKLMGAPDCLIEFDEFIYEIQSSLSSSNLTLSNNKSNERGFINYNASNFIFQEGGRGRGDGQNYINQWRPEFDPQKKVDNIKIQVGDTGFTGSENIVNTKELRANLSPAKGVECDVFSWYQLSGTCWVWGTTGAPSFSAITVPYEYAIPNCDFVSPESITGMSLSQYLEYIYASNIEPRNRKTNAQVHTSWMYPELKRIYMNYYFMTSPESNRLTIKKLEPMLDILSMNFQDYILQMVPATTIFESQGIVYRNTIFHRQKFVYKEGINDGSEFQNALPPDLNPIIVSPIITPVINDYIQVNHIIISVNAEINTGIRTNVNSVKVTASINENNIDSSIDAVTVDGEIQESVSFTTPSPSPSPFVQTL